MSRLVSKIIKTFSIVSFKNKLTVITLLFFMIPTSILLTIYMRDMRNAEKNRIFEETTGKLRSSVNALNIYCTNAEQQVNFLSNYYPLTQILSVEQELPLEQIVDLNQQMEQIITAIQSGQESGITIYTSNRSLMKSMYIHPLDEFFDSELAMELIKKDQTEMTWIIDDEAKEICLYKKYMFFGEVNSLIELRRPLNELIDRKQINLPEGSLLYFENYAKKIQLIGEKNGLWKGTYERISYPVPALEGQCTAYIPDRIFIKGMIGSGRSLLITLVPILILALSMFLIHLTIKMMTNRLSEIVGAISKKQEPKTNEFMMIQDHINQLITQARQDEKNKRRMQLQLLQERINPHFLYNTLSAIRWAYMDDKLTEVIDSMVRYYRIMLSRGSDLILLAKEIEGAEEYLHIQTFAYDQKINSEIIVDEDIREIEILKNILQPLVENAFLHGIKNMESGKGIIKILAQRIGDNIEIRILDNGCGCDVVEMNERIAQDEVKNDQGGYALININRRIKLFYGQEYGLVFEEVPEGTCVCISIPFKEKE